MTASDAPSGKSEKNGAEEFLEAFNAEDALEHPDEPPKEPPSPANDTEVLPPG